MCYPKPAPRCSNHAKKILSDAVASGDEAKIKEARKDYMLTPEGIKAVRKKDPALADKLTATRKQAIAEHHEREAQKEEEVKERVWAEFRQQEARASTSNVEATAQTFLTSTDPKKIGDAWDESMERYSDISTGDRNALPSYPGEPEAEWRAPDHPRNKTLRKALLSTPKNPNADANTMNDYMDFYESIHSRDGNSGAIEGDEEGIGYASASDSALLRKEADHKGLMTAVINHPNATSETKARAQNLLN